MKRALCFFFLVLSQHKINSNLLWLRMQMLSGMPVQTEGVTPAVPVRAQICSFHYLSPSEILIN